LSHRQPSRSLGGRDITGGSPPSGPSVGLEPPEVSVVLSGMSTMEQVVGERQRRAGRSGAGNSLKMSVMLVDRGGGRR